MIKYYVTVSDGIKTAGGILPGRGAAALTESAAEALLQMQMKHYDIRLRQARISRICHVVLAFCGKHFQVQYAIRVYPQSSIP